MRHDRFKLIIDIFLGLILAISVILAGLFYADTSNLEVLNYFLYWAYVLLGIAILIAFIIGPLSGMIQNPKSAIKGVISVIVLLGIFGIAYALSSDTPVDVMVEIKNMDLALRLADTSLISMYILGALGILAIIIAELKELLH